MQGGCGRNENERQKDEMEDEGMNGCEGGCAPSALQREATQRAAKPQRKEKQKIKEDGTEAMRRE
jgi:hypothetical protein